MIDPELKDLITRWETLGWFDKKYICWISFWATREVCPKMIVTIIVALAVIATMTLERDATHRTLELSGEFLFYFYALAIDYFYSHRREQT
jgi:hypothetical protein